MRMRNAITDLKRDARFKYVTVFKNEGPPAGEEWTHAHSQITATTFVPRRILYELRAARRMVSRARTVRVVRHLEPGRWQQKRVVDTVGDYYAFCPYASRVPFETWLMPKTHNHQFEAAVTWRKAPKHGEFVGATLRRLLKVSPSYHLVVHTAPNTLQTKGELSEYWSTIADDYHWHFEILPIMEQRSKSYSIKEVYFNGTLSGTSRRTIAADRSQFMRSWRGDFRAGESDN